MSDNPVMMCKGVPFSVLQVHEYVWHDGPGVYMLCRRSPNGVVAILYVGQAQSIAQRLGPSHEHWEEAIRLGMNEVHVHLLAKAETERRAVEADLINAYSPPLNRQKPATNYLHEIFAKRIAEGLGKNAESPLGLGLSASASRGIGLAKANRHKNS